MPSECTDWEAVPYADSVCTGLWTEVPYADAETACDLLWEEVTDEV